MRVLIATDGSERAASACELGRTVAAPSGEVRFVAVLPPASELLQGPWPAATTMDPAPIEEAAAARLDACLREEVVRTSPELHPTAEVLRGQPADRIVAEAGRWRAELIVVGSRGRGSLAAMLFGSVSEAVIDRSPIPVLVARGRTARRLLLAVDPSPASEAAVEFVVGQEAFRGAAVTTLGVTSINNAWWLGLSEADAASVDASWAALERAEEDERAAIAAAADRLAAAGLEVTTRQHNGSAGEELGRMATELDIDLIVVGSHGRTGIARLLLGSVGRRVLHGSHCSVLFVRAPAGHPAAEQLAATASATVPTRERKEHEMKILLAYDGGEPARRALETAASIAKVMGASVDVISVVPVHPGRSPIDPWDDRPVHTAELEDARTRLAGLGIQCRLLEPAGNPAEEIEIAARQGGHDMIVLGSRRQSAVGRVFQGSVSTHVATHADATVVIAR
jgi:nucleotide-binding universal stress UspA family protein